MKWRRQRCDYRKLDGERCEGRVYTVTHNGVEVGYMCLFHLRQMRTE